MKNNYRYVVIGGGPAGSAIATSLAQSGSDVCVVEKKEFPREVICGEFLSKEVIKALRHRGLFEKFLKLNPEKINSFRLINSNGLELYSEFDFEAYALRRSAFDKLLLDDAVRNGAALFSPAEVKSLTENNNKIELNVISGVESLMITADIVIAAYGRQNPLDKHLNRNFTRIKSGYTGMKFHLHKSFFRKPPFAEIQIYLAEGIYCGINPVDGDEYTVCFLSDDIKNPGSPRDKINFLMKSNLKFGELFNPDFQNIFSELKQYGTTNVYFGRKEKWGGNIYFTGDAAGVIAPLAGDGIGMALESANLLARHLINGSGSKDHRDYLNEWNKLFSSRLRFAKYVQSILFNSFLRNPAVLLAGSFPAILKYTISKTRSGV